MRNVIWIRKNAAAAMCNAHNVPWGSNLKVISVSRDLIPKQNTNIITQVRPNHTPTRRAFINVELVGREDVLSSSSHNISGYESESPSIAIFKGLQLLEWHAGTIHN